MPESSSSSLYVRSVGAGPELVLVHGWGMHAGVWEDVVEVLADAFRVTVLDLPGHGYSRRQGYGHGLADLARVVAAAAPPRACWVGWSLGGLVAQRLALDIPQRVTRLALVASSPCFTRRSDWSHAMDYSVLHQFAENLERDYRATLDRFLALEVHGGEHARTLLRQLREMVFQHGEPDPEALADGLAILETADLRGELAALTCPVLLLTGRRDTLVPASAGAAFQALLPNARHYQFPTAGHGPFFTHLEEFVTRLREFAHD